MIKVEPIVLGNNQNGYQEDLDLIEVLWRQDIDLGIGREAFDDNLRHELEAKRELELQKDREKNKERELLQLKHEEQCRQQEQQWLSENFMQDGETGEWVPLSGRDVSQNSLPQFHPPSQPQPTEIYRPHQPLQANFMQYGNMNIVNPEVARECETFQMHQSLEVLSPPHPPPVQTQQCPQHSNYVTDSNSYRNPLPQTLPTSPMVPDVPYPTVVQEHPAYSPPIQEYQRHDSLEQRWMDLVNLLDLNPGTESHMSMLMNASMVSNATELASRTRNPVRQLNQDNSSDVLLQNATMPAMPSSINATMSSFDNAGLLQPRTYNSSVPSEGNASPLVWEPSRMLFPNITDSLNSEDSLEEVDELLPDIISDDMLEEITSADMPLTDGLLRMHVVDDGSSDSAMGSDIGSESPPQDYDSMSSPSDGLGGAMGGSPGYSHPSKYSPDDYNPNGNAYSLSPGGSSGQSNYSSSSNDTGFGFSESNNQIQHNHTYPCQPGAQPKEVKKYMKSDTPRQKGPHPRDRKRVDELNIPFTVDQIVESQVEEFNELLSGHKLADNQLQLVRDIRRRGKNKVAAHNCRKRKLDVIFTLEDEMTSLINAKERLVQERHMIDKQTHEMKDKFGQLYKEIFQSLRDEHGHPYDPQQFSLQQSSDGNVFLVPRNVSMDDQDSKINKKRKNDKKK